MSIQVKQGDQVHRDVKKFTFTKCSKFRKRPKSLNPYKFRKRPKSRNTPKCRKRSKFCTSSKPKKRLNLALLPFCFDDIPDGGIKTKNKQTTLIVS